MVRIMKVLAFVASLVSGSVSALRDVRPSLLRGSSNDIGTAISSKPSPELLAVLSDNHTTQSNKHSQAPDHDVWIELSNFENIQYMGPMTIGGQILPVVYDTGSFELVIMSDKCDENNGCSRPAGPVYSSSLSSTFKPGSGKTHTHVYGSGPVTSTQGMEQVIMGDPRSPLVATDMPFWQVTDHDVDVWNKWSNFSGIVGMGHSPHAPNNDAEDDDDEMWHPTDKSLLEMVGVTAFSICLERSAGTPPGWLVLGPTAEGAQHDSRFVHVPVVGKIHWGVVMTQLKGGGMEAYDACVPSCAAIVDSGTSLIAAPREAMEALAPVFNMIDPNCNLDNLPDITFNLGSGQITIPPAIYVIRMTGYMQESQNIVESLFGPPKLRKVTQCIPAFMEVNMQTQHGPLWILGMPFLRYYYTVFQREPKSLHMAFATAQCDPSADPASIYFANHSGFANTSNMRVGRERDAIKTVNVSQVKVPDWVKPGLKGSKAKKVMKIEF